MRRAPSLRAPSLRALLAPVAFAALLAAACATAFATSSDDAERRRLDSLRLRLKNPLDRSDSSRPAVLNALAEAYVTRNPSVGLDYALLAQQTALRQNNRPALAAALNIIGVLYWEKGNNDAAQEYHFRALKLAEEIRDSTELCRAYMGLGSLFNNRKKYAQALEYHHKALAFAERLSDKSLLARLLNGMGATYRNKGDNDTALAYFRRSLAVYEERRLSEQIYRPLFNIGYLFFNEGRYDDASEYVFKALRYALAQGNGRVIAESYLTIADIAAKQNHLNIALEFADRALRIADSLGIKPTIAEIYQSLGEFHRNAGNYREALEYGERYHAVNDSLISMQSSTTIAEMQTRYEADKREQRIQAELDRKQIVQYVLIGGCAALLAVMALLWRLYAGKRRSESALQATNAEILRQQGLLENQASAIELANSELHESNAALQKTNELLDAEKKLSDSLLLNVLPQSIATRLKAGEQRIAEKYASVTVLFADIVGFTKLSLQLPPDFLIALLDTIFSEFDNLAERYGVEKIKTVGDAYMAVSGLAAHEEDHARRVALLGMDMCEVANRLASEIGIVGLAVRVGIHTGAAVAGVIGTKKFSYDLWGDTVNIASRMESHGRAGRAHCTREVRDALRDEFEFEERGWVEIKGKGEMQTYFLIGKRADGNPATIA